MKKKMERLKKRKDEGRRRKRKLVYIIVLWLLMFPCYAFAQRDRNSVAGTNNICVKFGIIKASKTIYLAREDTPETPYSSDAREGSFVSNQNGWVVQDDYTETGYLANEAALVEYLNDNRNKRKGTEITLLPVAEDGFIYDDGINYLSVLGDSISTLSGVTDMAGYNSETQGNAARYLNSKGTSNDTGATLVLSQEETWWFRVISETDSHLLVNSSVRGTTAAGGIKRCFQLSSDHDIPGEMHRNTAPDTIIIYLGTNDYRKKSLTATQFYEDYYNLLKKICGIYTGAQIYCIDITDCYAPGLSVKRLIDGEPGVSLKKWDGTNYRLQHFNEQIIKAINMVNTENGYVRIHPVNLSNQNWNMLQTLNLAEDEDMTDAKAVNCGKGKTWLSLHPGAEGQELIGEAVIEAMNGRQIQTENYNPALLLPQEDFLDINVIGEEGIWKVDTLESAYLPNGEGLCLDRQTISEPVCIKKILIPVMCISQDLFEGTGQAHLWISVMDSNGNKKQNRDFPITLPNGQLNAAFLKNFHTKGEMDIYITGQNRSILRWERGGRITEGPFKDSYYIGEYIEIPVNISVGKNEMLMFCKDNSMKLLIDSNLIK